jgi:hypothetical protein
MNKFVDTTIAIKSLCPDSEFVMYDNDYSTIQWHIEPKNVPTANQVHAEIQRLLLG